MNIDTRFGGCATRSIPVLYSTAHQTRDSDTDTDEESPSRWPGPFTAVCVAALMDASEMGRTLHRHGKRHLVSSKQGLMEVELVRERRC